MTITYGKFRMFMPTRSRNGYILIGALVGADKTVTYLSRLAPRATRDDMRREYGKLRERIHKDHPGIKEEFTLLRPKVAFN